MLLDPFVSLVMHLVSKTIIPDESQIPLNFNQMSHCSTKTQLSFGNLSEASSSSQHPSFPSFLTRFVALQLSKLPKETFYIDCPENVQRGMHRLHEDVSDDEACAEPVSIDHTS